MDNQKTQIALFSGLSFLLGYGFCKIISKNNKKSQAELIKDIVRQKYGEIAKQPIQLNKATCCGVGGGCGQGSGCGSSGKCGGESFDYTIFAEDYSKLQGYNKDADLGLGCGMPTEFALIKQGDIVVDLGSGYGNDCFVARALTGEKGKVLGIDMTPEMIIQSQVNADKKGFLNVEFRMGEIEHMPVLDNYCDVVLSNCVLNLVPNKQQAYNEMFRILKQGGHFSISDVVLVGKLPDRVRKAAEFHVGCVAGALQVDEQMTIMKNAGFVNIEVKKEKEIVIPKEVFIRVLTEEDYNDFLKSGAKILSQTVYGEKPVPVIKQ